MIIFYFLFLIQPLLFQTNEVREESIVQEVIKLYESGVSDDLLILFIENYRKPFQLSGEDLILLKSKNIPEDLIKIILKKQTFLMPEKKKSFEEKDFKPLILKQKFLKKDRSGTLVIKEDRIEWLDNKDPSSNFSFKIDNIKSVWLKCKPRVEKYFCYEIVFSNYKGNNYLFSDFKWELGENNQITSLYNFLKENFKNIVFSEKLD